MTHVADGGAIAFLRLDEVPGHGPARRTRDGQVRQVELAGTAVDYRLIRARRRTVSPSRSTSMPIVRRRARIRR
jgi:hypothetical protein